MLQLDLFYLPDTWWQHLIVFLISGVVGYGVGLRKGGLQISILETSLAQARGGLLDCQQNMLELTRPVEGSFDDFKVIEGIGPQIEKRLHQRGIRTYSQLSLTAPDRIKEIFIADGRRFRVRNSETWPHQALLAATGQWSQLRELQAGLDTDQQ